MTHHALLYIPGFGDQNLGGRRKLLSLWHFQNTSIEICSMRWSVNEPWPIKLDRLVARIDQLHAGGKVVSLIGESAGASAVTQALRLRTEKIHAVILLCGKSQHPETVNPRLFKQNPAFKVAVTESDMVARSLTDIERGKLLNLHPIFDPVVPVKETKIPGVKNARMPIIGHATSIVFANTLWSFRIVRFIRKKTS